MNNFFVIGFKFRTDGGKNREGEGEINICLLNIKLLSTTGKHLRVVKEKRF